MRSPIPGDTQLVPVWGTSPTARQALSAPYSQTPARGCDLGDDWDAFTATALAQHIPAFAPARSRLRLRHGGDKPEEPQLRCCPVTPKGVRGGWLLLHPSGCSGVPRDQAGDRGHAPPTPSNVLLRLELAL